MQKNEQNNPFSLPADLSGAYHEVERNFSELLQAGRFDESRRSWEHLYNLFLEKQKQLGCRLHKGGVLHNLGIVDTLSNHVESAFKNFILAYAEDVASQEQGFAGNAEGAPAARALKIFYGIQQETLDVARKVVVKKLAEGDFSDARTAFKIFLNTKFGEKALKDRINLLEKSPFVVRKYSINSPPGQWNKRVFIGGNYGSKTVGNLYEIKNLVVKKGYFPIIALEFTDKEPPIHDHSLLLLHNCKYAIFDVTKDSGYLMEVERTLDYRTETLLVYQKVDGVEDRMSAMIRSLGKELKPFSNTEELSKLIDNFLP